MLRDNMEHKEYLVKVIDEDNETYNIKTFAYTMKEAIDNIVVMPLITHIVHIHSDQDDKKWLPTSKLELSDLRKIRAEITNEKELLEILVNNNIVEE